MILTSAGHRPSGRHVWLRTIILLLPPLILLSAYLAVLTLGAMITFNFLFLGLLLLAVNGFFDLAVNLILRLFR